MANTLSQMIYEMQGALQNLKSKRKYYPDSKAFARFLEAKTNDYNQFVRLVSELRQNAFAPEVVDFLKRKKAHYKFLGMTQRPEGYFKVTKKLLNEIENEKSKK